MSTNVTPAEVQMILPDTEIETAVLQSFITSADVFLTTCGVSASAPTELSEVLVKWLTAHLIVSTIERQAILEKAGSAEQRFANIYEKNLFSTSYGQMVVQMDTTGILRKLAMERKPINVIAVPTTV